MPFVIPCPNCGERSVEEFRFGGELRARPRGDVPAEEWYHYVYFRGNPAGEQKEWWFHQYGCRKWFLALRDVTTNEVKRTFWAEPGVLG